jgi:hypothetical protein
MAQLASHEARIVGLHAAIRFPASATSAAGGAAAAGQPRHAWQVL